jgi:hypothetical protein
MVLAFPFSDVMLAWGGREMRKRNSALFVGIAILTTTLAMGPPAATAGTPKKVVPTADYTLQVKTGHLKDAGSDPDVFVRFIGSSSSWGFTELDDRADNWERNRLDSFPLSLPPLGTVTQICIRKQGGNDWYLAWASIGGRTASFYRWMKGNVTACQPAFPTTPYTLEVKTGNLKDAGSDPDVFASFTGSSASFGEIELDDYSDNWERNRLDSFPLSLPPLGTVTRICIRKSGGNDWYLAYAKMGGRTASFYQWLHGNTTVCRPALP